MANESCGDNLAVGVFGRNAVKSCWLFRFTFCPDTLSTTKYKHNIKSNKHKLVDEGWAYCV